MFKLSSGQMILGLVALATGLLGPAAAHAQQENKRYTVITGTGQSLYRIAVPRVLDAGGAARAAKTAHSVLTRDMTLIGVFKLLNPKGFLANLKAEGVSIVPRDWINVGAQGVIKARAAAIGSKVRLEFYLYDVAKGTKAVLSKTYKCSPRSVRHYTHKFGDEVVKHYTGERGIFTTKITFATGNSRSKRSFIYAMDYDGHGVYKVSRTGRLNVLPDWSPGGKIAYTSFLWRNPDLYVVSGAGGRAFRISKRSGLNTGAAWSPRGNAIALTLSKDGNSELYLISPKGKILRRLTRNRAIDTSPTWSPDGSQIAFVSNRGGTPQIYVMSARGGKARRLTFQGNYNQEPDWCPKRSTPLVAFTARDEKGAYDIFTVDVKSGAVKRLTQGQGTNMSPSWAPNGRLLVYYSTRGGLWIMDADGLNQHRIYRGAAKTPDWSY